MLRVSMEDAWSGSGGCSGSTVRDAEANRTPRENLSALYFCAVMAQINGGPQLLPGNVKLRVLRVLVPSPLGLSPPPPHLPPPPPPPLHGMTRSCGRPGSVAVLAVAVRFSRGSRCLELCPPALGRDLAPTVWLCTNPLQAPICIFSFFPLFWLRNQPCPPYPPQGHGVPICASRTLPVLSSPVPSSAANSSPSPAGCQFPSAAAGTLRRNCPFLAPFCSIWRRFSSARGVGGHSRSPVTGTRVAQGWHCVPVAVLGTADTRVVGWSECSEV